MKLFLSILLFILLISASTAQTDAKYAAIDKLAQQIPDSVTHTISGLAKQIGSKSKTDAGRIRILFAWIASNIRYDIEKMAGTNFYQDKREVIGYVLKTRRGVCLHYAQLFSETAGLLGIKTYVITGYTQQNGSLDFIAHAWCAAQIDSEWHLFDPTWGSGYIRDSRFVKKINNDYFMVSPDKMIHSHMPFDPIWQFLNYPVTNQEFSNSKTAVDTSKPLFNFRDSLKKYEQLPEIEKLESSFRRMRQNGVTNQLIADKLNHTKEEIDFYYANRNVEHFNSAVKSFNEGVTRMNSFIDYRNRQFNPMKTDEEIKLMLSGTDRLLNEALQKLEKISNPDQATAMTMEQLKKSIAESAQNLDEQKAFLDKYLKTGKPFRKTLFYTARKVKVPAK